MKPLDIYMTFKIRMISRFRSTVYKNCQPYFIKTQLTTKQSSELWILCLRNPDAYFIF